MKLDHEFMISTIAGEHVLVPVGSKEIGDKGLITLSPVGVYIVRLIQEGKDEDEIIASILKEYDIDRQTVEHDLAGFISSLCDHGVLCEI